MVRHLGPERTKDIVLYYKLRVIFGQRCFQIDTAVDLVVIEVKAKILVLKEMNRRLYYKPLVRNRWHIRSAHGLQVHDMSTGRCGFSVWIDIPVPRLLQHLRWDREAVAGRRGSP